MNKAETYAVILGFLHEQTPLGTLRSYGRSVRSHAWPGHGVVRFEGPEMETQGSDFDGSCPFQLELWHGRRFGGWSRCQTGSRPLHSGAPRTNSSRKRHCSSKFEPWVPISGPDSERPPLRTPSRDLCQDRPELDQSGPNLVTAEPFGPMWARTWPRLHETQPWVRARRVGVFLHSASAEPLDRAAQPSPRV